MDPTALQMTPARMRKALAQTGSWPVLNVVSWLAVDGHQCATLEVLTEQFGLSLTEAGAPVSRILLILRTLNPQVTGRSCEWRQAEQLSTENISHDTLLGTGFIGSPIEYLVANNRPWRKRLHALNAQDHQILHELAAVGATDYLGVPLFGPGNASGAICIFNTNKTRGFDDHDIEKLLALAQCLSPIANALAAEQTAKSLLDTYLGRRTSERVLNGQIRRGDGESIRAALWYSDLRESTALTEQLPLAEFLDALNAYFALVADAVTARGGEVLRFIGDAMLIVFSEVEQNSNQDACEAAVDATVDARSALDTLNHRRKRHGQPELHFGVGLHYGDVIYGNVGAHDRLDFTVMGAAVNRTARLESLTKSLNEPVLMSQEFASHLRTPVRNLGLHELRGVAQPQEIFAPTHD